MTPQTKAKILNKILTFFFFLTKIPWWRIRLVKFLKKIVNFNFWNLYSFLSSVLAIVFAYKFVP